MRFGFDARFLPEFALASALCALSVPALAADTSAWDNDTRSSVRLIAAQREPGSAVLRAGVEIKLQAGWKTYWRYPGDSGVPPAFDFAASDNVKSATVLWPAPVRFLDGGGHSIGYKSSVIFPVRVEPRDPNKPVTLRLSLEYAVCETLCVPAKGKVQLSLPATGASQEATLKAAEGAVPKHRKPAEGAGLAIRKVWRDVAGGKPRVLVDVAAASGAEVDLFAEGPAPDWALPLPAPIDGAPDGARRFAFELDGLPSGAKPEGAAITLTVTAGQGPAREAIETVVRLD